MKNPHAPGLSTLWVLSALLGGGAIAQTAPRDLGKQEFDTHCASCHGENGQGNGPFSPYLRGTPPDLTGLAKGNGGIFPSARVAASIEGGNVPGHSTRDMPIWGSAYRVEAGQYYMDVPYDPAAFVRARILALVDYIHRIQVR